jgi:prophage regulatory protein
LNELKLVRFIRLPELRRISGLGKTTIYAMIKEDEFPRPVQIGGKAVGWVESEIIEWANARIAKARLTPTQQSLPRAA